MEEVVGSIPTRSTKSPNGLASCCKGPQGGPRIDRKPFHLSGLFLPVSTVAIDEVAQAVAFNLFGTGDCCQLFAGSGPIRNANDFESELPMFFRLTHVCCGLNTISPRMQFDKHDLILLKMLVWQ